MQTLDRTEQRIVGVLIEKQLAVPDSYPMTENALVDGCNQKSNREPVTEYESFQIAGALMSLQEKGWVARVEGGGRATKFKHRAGEVAAADGKDLAVLAELLLRGPQAAGALKTRVARMGLHGTPEEIEARLRGLAGRHLVEQLPLGPRERDRRWRHLVGDGSEAQDHGLDAEAALAPAPAHVAAAPMAGPDLAARVARLEQQVAELQQALANLQATGRQG
jgi:uncharacterized protein YceH (UPF0502 family)